MSSNEADSVGGMTGGGAPTGGAAAGVGGSAAGGAGLGERPLSWAAYLGVSWTWVIGMFLPVLLLRDHGIAGYLVFLVPNVVGAAAMGFVLRRGGSVALASRHRPMMILFSLVTIALHGYFLGWMLSWATLLLQVVALVPMVLTGLVGTVERTDNAGRLVEAKGVLALSAALAVVFWLTIAKPVATAPMVRDAAGLPWLAVICVFGFGLCPYLDLTFHRAAAASGERRRTAFAVGFGVVFLAMMGLVLGYGPTLWNAIDTWQRSVREGSPLPIGADAVFGTIVLFIVVQGSFTCSQHLAELRGPVRAPTGVLAVVWVAVPAVLGFFADGIGRAVGSALPISGGEVGYRLLLGLYGLVFPAYVWLVMLPTRDGHHGLVGEAGRRKRTVWALSCLVAGPMFLMGGMVRGEWQWMLLPAAMVPVLARLLLPGGAGVGRLTGGPEASAVR